jgi:hypothetical protein
MDPYDGLPEAFHELQAREPTALVRYVLKAELSVIRIPLPASNGAGGEPGPNLEIPT